MDAKQNNGFELTLKLKGLKKEREETVQYIKKGEKNEEVSSVCKSTNEGQLVEGSLHARVGILCGEIG